MKLADKNEMSCGLITKLALRTKSKISATSKKAQIYCPFHEDKEPSLFLNMDKGIFHCFSCRRKGTINALCKELTGTNIYKFLDVKYDEFNEFSKKYEEKVVDFDKLPEIRIVESDNGESRLGGVIYSRKINRFMRQRGLNRDILKEMKMFTLENLITFNGTRFQNRICIPIYEGGRLLSVEGRALDNETFPKVMYPKGSSVSTIFEYDKLDRTRTLWVVEGLMDLALLRQDDFFKNSSCLFGANITSRQKHLLKKFSSVVYIKENDNAGNECVKDLASIPGIEKGYLKLPTTLNNFKIKDVGDFVKAGYNVRNFREEKNWIEVGLVKLH